MEHTAGLVQGNRGTPAPMVKFLLGAPVALIVSITGKAHDMEGIHDRPRAGEFFSSGARKAGESIHRDDLNALTRHLQPQAVQTRESAQIRAIKDSIGHVEVFQMDGVGTPIIERPRPLPGHDTHNAAHNTYTLKCEEPLYLGYRRTLTLIARGLFCAPSIFLEPDLPKSHVEQLHLGINQAITLHSAPRFLEAVVVGLVEVREFEERILVTTALF